MWHVLVKTCLILTVTQLQTKMVVVERHPSPRLLTIVVVLSRWLLIFLRLLLWRPPFPWSPQAGSASSLSTGSDLFCSSSSSQTWKRVTSQYRKYADPKDVVIVKGHLIPHEAVAIYHFVPYSVQQMPSNGWSLENNSNLLWLWQYFIVEAFTYTFVCFFSKQKVSHIASGPQGVAPSCSTVGSSSSHCKTRLQTLGTKVVQRDILEVDSVFCLLVCLYVHQAWEAAEFYLIPDMRKTIINLACPQLAMLREAT